MVIHGSDRALIHDLNYKVQDGLVFARHVDDAAFSFLKSAVQRSSEVLRVAEDEAVSLPLPCCAFDGKVAELGCVQQAKFVSLIGLTLWLVHTLLKRSAERQNASDTGAQSVSGRLYSLLPFDVLVTSAPSVHLCASGLVPFSGLEVAATLPAERGR